MLGPSKVRDLDHLVLVSLDALVPRDNLYRQLDKILDLAFVRDWVKDCYADGGRPSIDPVVFFRLQLVMYLEGLRSERQLMRLAADRLSVRWFLGYGLDEALPDHSTLTRIRERYGLDTFRRFFEHVVDLCEADGLIRGREVLVDATKVPGNASKDSLVPRLKEVVDDHLVELFDDGHGPESRNEGDAESAAVSTAEVPQLLHPEASPDVMQQNAERWDVLEECRLDPNRPAPSAYERLSSRKVSRTDPDAMAMSMRDGRTALGYQVHYLVDGGTARIILHCLVTPGDVIPLAKSSRGIRLVVRLGQWAPTHLTPRSLPHVPSPLRCAPHS